MKQTYVAKVTKRNDVHIPVAVFELLGLANGQYVKVTIETELKGDT